MTANRNSQDLNVHVGPLTDRINPQSQGIVIFMVNTDTGSLTNSKANQSSKNDSEQLYIKHVKNYNINN